MVIGFTGSRHGMSQDQYDAVKLWISGRTEVLIGVHGDCIGADVDFHHLMRNRPYPIEIGRIELRPGFSVFKPDDMNYRAGLPADLTHPPEPFLARNRAIVDQCDGLLACPYDKSGKGGTWSTIKYAQKVGKRYCIFHRNGEIERP